MDFTVKMISGLVTAEKPDSVVKHRTIEKYIKIFLKK